MKEKMQEVFDTVREHLLKQMAQAKRGNTCMYTDSVGNKCAVGCLIKPEHYNPCFEGTGIANLMAALDGECDLPGSTEKLWDALRASLGYEPDKDMLRMMRVLQNTHDEHDPSEWECKLKQVAFDFGLAY